MNKQGKLVRITLKAARVNQGLTQKEAAEKLGISKDTVYNYEKGKTFPNEQMIKKMEKLYNVGYDNLIFLPNDND